MRQAHVILLMTFLACSSDPGGGGGPNGSDGGPNGDSGGACCGNGLDSGNNQGSDAGPCTSPSTNILPNGYGTLWNPGIIEDKQLKVALGEDGLPVRSDVCATLKPGDNIQGAIDACPEGKVVQLGAGTFNIQNTVTLKKGVVLRGSGSQGAPMGTTIVKNGGTALAIGDGRDQTCYGGQAYPLLADGQKEQTTLSVGASVASKLTPGQLALVDETDDPVLVQQGDCAYFKRVSGRSASQRVEIQSVDAGKGTVTLSAPLHWSFRVARQAMITPVVAPTVRWAGIEKLRIQGGTNPGYNGQMAGGVDISNAAYSWVKDVQTDATIGGMHISATGTYRVVVRDSYVHHSADYGFGHDCYGIVIRCGASESLIENNIARYMNKPIMMNSSGGGNVIAYNYADNSWATPAEWQEVNIDTHCSYPHMELMEGNYAPHMGATTTHGNAGFLTFFRNYASSVFAPPAVAGSNATQSGNIEAIQLQAGDVSMSVVGNVLGSDKVSKAYETYNDSNTSSIFSLGGANDVSTTTLFRTGNYDAVSKSVKWDAKGMVALPPSLYTCKPRWWPSTSPWPWVGPDLSPMVGTLPAKDRSDKM